LGEGEVKNQDSSSASSWNLRNNGDHQEQAAAEFLGRFFPNYEQFWQPHVAPLTFRDKTQDRVRWVRPGVDPPFRRLASTHYSVFLRLQLARKQLEDPRTFDHIGEFSVFYWNLYASGSDMLHKFIFSSAEILNTFRKGKTSSKKIELRICKDWEDSTLWTDYCNLMEQIGRYRNCSTHNPILILIGANVPKWDRLPKPPEKEDTSGYFKFTDAIDLSAVTQALGDELKFRESYVSTHKLLTAHLQDYAVLLNRVWTHVLKEFEPIGLLKKYKDQQRKTNRIDDEFLRNWEAWIKKNGDPNNRPGAVGTQGPIATTLSQVLSSEPGDPRGLSGPQGFGAKSTW